MQVTAVKQDQLFMLRAQRTVQEYFQHRQMKGCLITSQNACKRLPAVLNQHCGCDQPFNRQLIAQHMTPHFLGKHLTGSVGKIVLRPLAPQRGG